MFYMAIQDEGKRLKTEELYYTYRNLMYKISYEILQDEHLAEDAISESFIRIIKNLHKIGEVDCPKTRNFLVIICRNVSKNMYNSRKKTNECDYLDEMAEDKKVTDPAEIVINKESVEKLSKVISSLDEKYKDVFILSRVYNISPQDIAGMLGITVENVRKRLQRAKEKILEEYNKEEIQ